MNRVGVWGDSITWGSYDLEVGGWVARLRHFIDNNYRAEPSVYNVGISGDKVGDVLDRFDVEYEARKPETVILAIGINDSPHESHPDGTPLNAFEQSYRELVQKAQTKAQKLIIVGLSNVDDEHPKNGSYRNDKIKPYNEIVKKVASELTLPFIDVSGLITSEDLKEDGLHPLASGHEKIYQKVKDVLLAELDLAH